MYTQAQQPHHLSSRRAETGTALSWSVTRGVGGVGWGGMITFMFLCTHRHSNLIIFLSVEQRQALLFHDQLPVGWGELIRLMFLCMLLLLLLLLLLVLLLLLLMLMFLLALMLMWMLMMLLWLLMFLCCRFGDCCWFCSCCWCYHVVDVSKEASRASRFSALKASWFSASGARCRPLVVQSRVGHQVEYQIRFLINHRWWLGRALKHLAFKLASVRIVPLGPNVLWILNNDRDIPRYCVVHILLSLAQRPYSTK